MIPALLSTVWMRAPKKKTCREQITLFPRKLSRCALSDLHHHACTSKRAHTHIAHGLGGRKRKCVCVCNRKRGEKASERE